MAASFEATRELDGIRYRRNTGCSFLNSLYCTVNFVGFVFYLVMACTPKVALFGPLGIWDYVVVAAFAYYAVVHFLVAVSAKQSSQQLKARWHYLLATVIACLAEVALVSKAFLTTSFAASATFHGFSIAFRVVGCVLLTSTLAFEVWQSAGRRLQ